MSCQFSPYLISWMEKSDVSNGLNKFKKKMLHQRTPKLTCQHNLKKKIKKNKIKQQQQQISESEQILGSKSLTHIYQKRKKP